MARNRLDIAQERQLWDMALDHLGSEGLLLLVVEMWSSAVPPAKPVVEHLSTKQVSQDVLNILKLPKSESELLYRAEVQFQVS